MRGNPMPLPTQQMLLDHHGRIAAVEVELREARADVAEIKADVATTRDDVAEIKRLVAPLADAALAAHQQTSTLLTYLFTACLAIAGGSVSAWLSGQARLDTGAQIAVSAGCALVCVLVANVAIRHARQ